MMAKSHMVFGTACWSAACVYTKQAVGPEVILAMIGGLLPDVDHPSSKFGRLVPFISYPVSAIFGHRGITHSLLAIVAMSVILVNYGATDQYIAPLVIGYLSHLIGDWITGGIPIFWPYQKKYSSPIVFETNSIAEPLAVLVLLIGLLFITGVDSDILSLCPDSCRL